MIQAENVRTFWYELPGNICGSMEITLNEIRIYDPLCIFYIRRREAETVFVKIMPEFELMPVEITRKTREFQTDAEEYSCEKKGDDPSEIYQVREYRREDS